MSIRSLLPLAALASLGAAAPALAWTGTSQTGDYRVTATLAPAGQSGLQSLSLSVAPIDPAAARATGLRAWFIDAEGLILRPATLSAGQANGLQAVAYDKALKVPAGATALVVLAQPMVSRTAAGRSAPAIVSQITLPQGIAAAGA